MEGKQLILAVGHYPFNSLELKKNITQLGEKAGLFDVSHMGEIAVKGEKQRRLLTKDGHQ